MKPDFQVSGISFYGLSEEQRKAILNNFAQTCGAYEIPIDVCRRDLIDLPSPMQSTAFKKAYTSGEISHERSSMARGILDVIRKESNP